MKRMNEVFELPVNPEDFTDPYYPNENAENFYISRAINHVDALADALDACVKALAEMPAGEPANESDRAYHQALEALNAYRGAK